MSLYADGQKRIVTTDATTVGDLLRRSGLHLDQGDLVEPSAETTIPTGFFNINIYRARPVTISDGAKTYHLSSAYSSPHLLADAAGVKTYPEDAYKSEIITDFVSAKAVGLKVDVVRAVPFQIKADGKVRVVRTQDKQLGQALKDANVALGPKDTASVSLAASITPGMTVTLTRVSEVVTTITQVIPRPVKTVTDPTMLKGNSTVQNEGSDGQKTALYRIHFRDGAETSRDLISVTSETAPEAKVVVEGTKVLFAGSVEYWRPLVETAAAANGIDPNTMMRIMACESGGNATSVSHFIVNGEHPMGLFQFLPSTWHLAGGTDDNILDGPTQIQLAARKMAKEGFSAWQCQ